MGNAGVEHPTLTLKRHPILDVLNTLLIREVNICFYLPFGKNETSNQNVIHWTITLITHLYGRVHFKTNYNYRLSNHCFINELILVTYALISNAVENAFLFIHKKNRAIKSFWKIYPRNFRKRMRWRSYFLLEFVLSYKYTHRCAKRFETGATQT